MRTTSGDMLLTGLDLSALRFRPEVMRSGLEGASVPAAASPDANDVGRGSPNGVGVQQEPTCQCAYGNP